MLATQLNYFVQEGKLTDFSIFKVKKYQCNNMQGKKVIIILELEVLQSGIEVNGRIGSPAAIQADGTLPPTSAPYSAPVDQNRPPNNYNDYNKRTAVTEAAGSPAMKTQRPTMLVDAPRKQGTKNVELQPLLAVVICHI